jgi:hypothetical protein
MNDILAKYRPKGAGLAPATPPPVLTTAKTEQREEYQAFVTKDHVARLRIRRAKEPTRSPTYGLLLDVVYDGQSGTNFILVYTFLMVLVRGRNLQQLVFALENAKADFIQEFDAERWAQPSDGKAAFIESIEIAAQNTAASASAAEEGDFRKH